MPLPAPWQLHEDNVQIESGQAHLFKVRQADDAASYALKRLKNPDRRERFDREIQAMKEAEASGLSIVPAIVDRGVDGKGRPYYVMPWYHDGSLEVAVLSGQFADPEVSIRLLLQLVDALEAIHACRWAHRDLKPANVLLEGDGLVLCDLGLALPVGADAGEARLTDTLEAVGSRYYIAPENESGISDEVDQRPADFYAFAKISWVLLSRRSPLAREAQLEQPNRLATITGEEKLAAWDEVCDQLLRPDPRVRLADWATVRTELESILTNLGNTQLESDYAPTELEALKSAASRLARSTTAHEVRTLAAARTEYQQQVSLLRKEAWEAAGECGTGGVNIHEISGGLLQANISDVSTDTLNILIGAGALDGLADMAGRDWDSHCLTQSSSGTMRIDGLFSPPPPSACLGGYLLTDQTHVWMLCVPFLATPGGHVLLPSLTARFRSLNGPYPLGLPSAKQAARSLGIEVATKGLSLAREYIDLLIAGLPVHENASWVPKGES